MGSEHGDDGLRRRGCSCTKDDFLPEESFKSMGNYFKALKETPSRFIDRVMTRSDDSAEIHDMKARSGNEMKKTLTWWDLMWFGVGAVIGSGIFVLTGQEARERSGPAVVLSFVVSGVSAMLSVFCYTEFAVEIPVAGKRIFIFLSTENNHQNILKTRLKLSYISLFCLWKRSVVLWISRNIFLLNLRFMWFFLTKSANYHMLLLLIKIFIFKPKSINPSQETSFLGNKYILAAVS